MRRLVRAIVVCLAICTAMSGPPNVTDIVALDAGRVRGERENGVESWRGIPFAAPPVGPLRWRAPQPVPPWAGVRPATAYAHDCMQVPLSSDAAPLGTLPSEDCLYLNVWRPAARIGRLPVMVWIHGGGFVNGGSSPKTYSGANLAREGILVVSVNYRLGRFGTFAHPELTRADADKGLLGNYGVLDQIAALRWVKRNIAAFGGDPDNVTIVGESAGGVSVHFLTTSPLAEGLFHRAVIMSGGEGGRPGSASLREIESLGLAFARAKGVDADDPNALAKLRAIPAEEVADDLNMEAMYTRPSRTYVGPFVDRTIVTDVGAAYASNGFHRVPMMIGATSGDLGGRTGFMIAGARRIAGMLADRGTPVYQYRFDYVAEAASHTAAQHAADIPFFFNTITEKYGKLTTGRDRAVGATLSKYLAAFVKTGDPNAAGLPPWPRYDTNRSQLMMFTRQGSASVQSDPWAEEIDRAPAPAYPDMIAEIRETVSPE